MMDADIVITLHYEEMQDDMTINPSHWIMLLLRERGAPIEGSINLSLKPGWTFRRTYDLVERTTTYHFSQMVKHQTAASRVEARTDSVIYEGTLT